MRLLIALFVVFVVYVAQLKMYKKYWNRGLSVKLRFSTDVVSFGDRVELIEVIENDKPLALPILNVKFATSRSFRFADEDDSNVSDRYYRNDIFSILGNQKLERRLDFVTTGRGVFRIKELQVSSMDLFLKHPFAYIMKNDTELIVLPQRIPVDSFMEIRTRMMGDLETNSWDNPDPFAFRGIRQYQSYDTMGSINWKATAKMGEIMVNQFLATTESEVKIYLNLKPYMKSKAEILAEHAINIVSTIAAEYISRGIRVGFYTNGWDIDSGVTESADALIRDRALLEADRKGAIENDDINENADLKNPELKSGVGKQHLKVLDIMLARLDISKRPSDMMKILEKGFSSGTNQNVTHIIVSTYRNDALYDFYERHMEKKAVYWIIPTTYADDVELKYSGMYRWDMK